MSPASRKKIVREMKVLRLRRRPAGRCSPPTAPALGAAHGTCVPTGAAADFLLPVAGTDHLAASPMPALKPVMSTRCFLMIWEVYFRLGLRPVQALHLLRRQGIIITPKQAKHHLSQAAERNTLRLVFFQ